MLGHALCRLLCNGGPPPTWGPPLHRGTPPCTAGPTSPTPRAPPPLSLHREIPPPLHRGIPPPLRDPPPPTSRYSPPSSPRDPLRFLRRAGPTPLPTQRDPPTSLQRVTHPSSYTAGTPPPPYTTGPTPIPTPRGTPPTPWDPTLHPGIPLPLHRGISPPYTAGSPPHSGISPYTAVFSFCLGEPSTPPPLYTAVLNTKKTLKQNILLLH